MLLNHKHCPNHDYRPKNFIGWSFYGPLYQDVSPRQQDIRQGREPDSSITDLRFLLCHKVFIEDSHRHRERDQFLSAQDIISLEEKLQNTKTVKMFTSVAKVLESLHESSDQEDSHPEVRTSQHFLRSFWPTYCRLGRMFVSKFAGAQNWKWPSVATVDWLQCDASGLTLWWNWDFLKNWKYFWH